MRCVWCRGRKARSAEHTDLRCCSDRGFADMVIARAVSTISPGRTPASLHDSAAACRDLGGNVCAFMIAMTLPGYRMDSHATQAPRVCKVPVSIHR